MEQRTHNVLFLCTGNRARSIMAEAYLTHVGAGRFKAFSAGSHPKKEPHPLVLSMLRDFGISTENARSKSWNEFAAKDAPQMDFVLTLCDDAAGETCPIWPGHPMTAHWGVTDPVNGTLDEFRLAFDKLRTRIDRFVTLPIDDLDAPALQRELDNIGEARQ